jgi:hypothetical protein
MADPEPTTESDEQPAADTQPVEASRAGADLEGAEAAKPTPAKRADVLRDFRKTLADRQRPGGGKFPKPAGGNPRFR